MRGHVRRRGKGWQAVVYAGRDADGKKHYRSRQCPTMAAAEAACRTMLAELGQGPPPDDSVESLLNRWYAHAAATKGWSPKTELVTRHIIDSTLIPRIGSRRVSDLRARDLDGLYATLRSSGGKEGGPLAASTVRRVHSVLSSALAQGVRWDLLAANPAAFAQPGVSQADEVDPPSDDDVKLLLKTVEDEENGDPDLFVFIHLAAVTGARRGELLGVKWPDLRGNVLHLRRSVVEGPSGVVVRETTKGKASRRLTLPAQTVSILDEHRERTSGRGFVFGQERDGREPWRPNTVTHRFIRLRRKVGVDERVRLHSLRHYAASVLIAAGVDVVTVANRLGHAKPTTTLRVYSHLREAADQAAADILGDTLR